MSESNCKLRVGLKRVEGLTQRGEVKVSFSIKNEISTPKESKPIDSRTGDCSWGENTAEFKFYNAINQDQDSLEAKVYCNSSLVGEGALLLDQVPKMYRREYKIKLGSAETYVVVSLLAETFGVDHTLFAEADINNILISKIHSPKDALKNAVINKKTGVVYNGIREALEKELQTPNPELSLIVFPGKYMFRGSIEIPPVVQRLTIFGIGNVSIEPFLNKEPIFVLKEAEASASPISITLHKLNFPKESSFLLSKRNGARLNLNSTTIGRIFATSGVLGKKGEEKNKEVLVWPNPSDINIGGKVKEVTKDKAENTNFLLYVATIIRSSYDLDQY